MLVLGKFEISQNFEYLWTLPGIAKVIEIVFCVVGFGLGFHSFHEINENWKQEYFKANSITIIGISVLYLIAHCYSDDLVVNKTNRIVDIVFHVLIGTHLIFGGSLLINSAANSDWSQCTGSLLLCADFELELGAGVLSVVDGLLYWITAYIVFRVRSL